MNYKSNKTHTKITNFMENLINEHGYTYKGIDWSRAEDQILRFDQFKYLFSNQNQSFSLNNLGCGLGDFFTWLLKNKLPINNYYGYELSDLAGPKNQKDFHEIKEYLKNLSTLEADFIQVSHEVDIRRGKIYLNLPGKLRIDYYDPDNILITSNGF